MSIRERRIVVVNDDGVDAPGLSILERARAAVLRGRVGGCAGREPERARAGR